MALARKGTNVLEDIKLLNNGKIIEIHIPMKFKRRGGRKEIILPPGVQPKKPPTALQLALARAFRWQKLIDTGEADSASDLARRLGLDFSLVARILRLALLAPDIVEAILDGREPGNLSLVDLRRPLPTLWEEQRQMLGFPAHD